VTLSRSDKEMIVSELSTIVNDSVSAAVAHYKGVTVGEMEELRKVARESDVSVGVYRNTLAKLAVKDTSFECINDKLVGPVVLLFSKEEPGAPARILRDFMKTNAHMQAQGFAVEGVAHDGDKLEALANLLSRQEALTQLVAVMKAPISKFVRTCKEPTAKFVRTLSAVSEKK
jgi:large subunit ribosomal protein L10